MDLVSYLVMFRIKDRLRFESKLCLMVTVTMACPLPHLSFSTLICKMGHDNIVLMIK